MKRQPTQSLLDRLAALGEVVRLRILRLLEAEELSVGEIAKIVQLPQSTVSRHLKVLLDGGWVVKRSEGTTTLYRLLHDDLPPAHRALWRTVREQIGSEATLDEDLRRLRGVLDERKTDSQTFFGRFGGQWDDLRNDLFGSRFTSLALLALLQRNWTIADLGCGTGNASELLAPVVDRVVAIDSSDTMLSAARQRLAHATNVQFLQAPIHATTLAPASIDAAACFLVLHHLPSPLAALQEMKRILRTTHSGGMALLVDMVRHDRAEYKRQMGHEHLGFAQDDLLPIIHDAGFARAQYRELPAEPDAKGPGLFVAVAWIK